jgi:hypothetical protein
MYVPTMVLAIIGAVLGVLAVWGLYVMKNQTMLRHFSKRSYAILNVVERAIRMH